MLAQCFTLGCSTALAYQKPSTRTLAFSFGPHHTFVMLPIALTLSDAWQAAVVVIVFQSLVELFGMVAYLSEMPSKLIPKPSPT